MSAAAPQLPPGSPAPENEVRLTFMEHLRDLRVRLMRAMMGVLAGMVAVGSFVTDIRLWLMAPVRAALPEGEQVLVYTSAIEPLMTDLRVALYGGIFVAAPWVLWQLWLFIAPGLYKREKKVVFPFLFWGTLLFYTGAAFCRYVVMPPAFPAMIAFAEGTDLRPMLAYAQQLSLVLGMMLGFAVVFEVPVIMAFLAMIGLVDAKAFGKYRRYAIIVNVVVAAIITPTGDPLNLAMMAGPMVVFYEIGIVLARFLGKKKAPETALAET